MIEVIKFYSVSHAYGELSNFFPCEFKLKGKTWRSVEHYFQAQKFSGTPYEQKIYKSNTPHQAAQFGRSRKFKIRSDWEKIKDNIMYEALLAKFKQNKYLLDILISTGDALLVENSLTDNYWGCGTNGKGLNKLGKLLIKVREQAIV